MPSLCHPSGVVLGLVVCRPPGGPPQLRGVVSLADLTGGAPPPVRKYMYVSFDGLGVLCGEHTPHLSIIFSQNILSL